MPTNPNKELLDELEEDNSAKGVCLGFYSNIKRDRATIDWRFYVNEMYYEGEHYARWNKYNQSIETPRPKKGEMRAVIPYAKSLVDANTTDIIKDDPEWNVMPQPNKEGLIDEPEIKKASWSNDLLDYYHTKLQMPLHNEVTVRSAVMHSVGWMYCNYDPEKKRFDGKGKGEIEAEPVSITDLYIPIHSRSVEDAPIVIRTMRKNIEYIRNSELYKDKKHLWEMELSPDNKVTDNDQQEHALNDTIGSTKQGDSDEMKRGTVLLAECYLRYYPEGEINPKYRIVTVAVNQNLLLRNVETDLERPPFFLYRTERKINQIYSQGKMGDLIPINRMIDNLESRILEYNWKFTKGQYVVDRGANINRVTNESGDIIQKNRGHAFTVVGLPQIPPTVDNQLARLTEYGQDVAGVHDVSQGKLPKGVESARAIENLVFGDQQARALAKANYALYLEELGKHILWLVSKYFSRRRLIQFYNREGDMQAFKVVGSQTDNPEKEALAAYEDTVMVKPDNDVKVTIGSGLGNTPEARQQKAMEGYKMGLWGKKTVLKTMQIGGNINDLAREGTQEAEAAEKMRKEQPEKDTRDYVNTKLSDLAPSERSQYLKSIGIEPTQDPSLIPGTPLHAADVADAQLPAAIQKQLAQSETGMHASIAQQEQESLNPALAGGVMSAPDELAALQGEQNDQQF